MFFDNIPIVDICKKHEIHRTTLHERAVKDGWYTERNAQEEAIQQIKKSYNEVFDPKTSADTIDDKTRDVFARIIHLAALKLEKLMVMDDGSVSGIAISNEIQKLTGALEKYTSAKIKAQSGGKKQITLRKEIVDWNKLAETIIKQKEKDPSFDDIEFSKKIIDASTGSSDE